MADTKGNKQKRNNVKSAEESGSNNKSLKGENTKPSYGEEKRTKKDEQDLLKLVDTPLPMESKGTDNILQDFPDIGKEKKNDEDGLIHRPLKWHPDEIHCDKLCHNCLKINYYWPPRLRPPTPPDKDPNLIYPGDVDPDFKPARGDILIVHPRGLGLDPKPSPEEVWWKSKRIGGGFCICFDGDKKFKFEEGDLILCIGSYIDGETEVETENEGQPMEGNKRTKKGKTHPKPKKIADPPQLDPVIYKPYDRVELYHCSGFEILTEDKPLDEDALEAELRRVFEANTTYELSMGKNVNPNGNNNSRKKSVKGVNPIGNEIAKQIPPLLLEDPKKSSSSKSLETSTDNLPEPLTDAESKTNFKAENLARVYVASRDLQKTQGSQKQLELQDLDTKEKASKDEKQSKIKLIWTFLGSQAKLRINDSIAPIADPGCPGLGCFYHPYFNLGNHCKKQEHTHAPSLGEILIPEGVWFKKFNHRKNQWRSMVEWYVPFCPSLPSPLEGEASLTGDLAQHEEASNSEIEKKKKNSSKKRGENDKDNKAGDKSTVAKGKFSDEEVRRNSMDSSKKEDGLVQVDLVGKKGRVEKGKEMVKLDESHSDEISNKADKAVQVPEDLDQVPKDEDLDSHVMPINWNNEPTLGTIVLRPLVGRKLEDEKTPVEEWKWHRKYKIWGSIEMYMVEHGTEGLDWVFWGKSDRICDTSYPPPQLGAKLKFLHPKDAKVEILRNGKELGEEPLHVKDDDTIEMPNEGEPKPKMNEVDNKKIK